MYFWPQVLITVPLALTHSPLEICRTIISNPGGSGHRRHILFATCLDPLVDPGFPPGGFKNTSAGVGDYQSARKKKVVMNGHTANRTDQCRHLQNILFFGDERNRLVNLGVKIVTLLLLCDGGATIFDRTLAALPPVNNIPYNFGIVWQRRLAVGAGRNNSVDIRASSTVLRFVIGR